MKETLLFNKLLNNPGAVISAIEESRFVEKRRFKFFVFAPGILKEQEIEFTVTQLIRPTDNELVNIFADGLVYNLETSEIICVSSLNYMNIPEDLSEYKLESIDPTIKVDLFRFVYYEKVFWFTKQGPADYDPLLTKAIKKYKDLENYQTYQDLSLCFKLENEDLILTRVFERDELNKFWLYQKPVSTVAFPNKLKTEKGSLRKLPANSLDMALQASKDGIIYHTFLVKNIPQVKLHIDKCKLLEAKILEFYLRKIEPLKELNTRRFGPLRGNVFNMIRPFAREPIAFYILKKFDREPYDLKKDFWNESKKLDHQIRLITKILDA